MIPFNGLHKITSKNELAKYVRTWDSPEEMQAEIDALAEALGLEVTVVMDITDD